MGTNGYYAYRYRGIYYVVWNHWDSYHMGLGRDLVREIPTDEEEFEEWLEDRRLLFDEEAKRLTELKNDPEVKLEKNQMNYYHGYASEPTEQPPPSPSYAYTYTFDLDRLAFSIGNTAHYRLDKIPRRSDQRADQKWMRYLVRDGIRCWSLSISTPRRYIADLSLPPPPISTEGTPIYNECNTTFIDTNDWRGQRLDTTQELATIVAKEFVEMHYSVYSNLTAEEASSSAFRHAALGLLYAASPNTHQWLTPIKEDWDKEATPRLKRLMFGTNSNTFWYRNRLIRLSSHLDIEAHLKSEIGLLVKAIRNEGRNECAGLLWSVQHLVYVSVSSKTVAHSQAIPILAACGPDLSEFQLGIKALVLCLTLNVSCDGARVKRAELNKQLSTESGKATFKKTLPPEIFDSILAFADHETHMLLSRLSRTCRSHCMARPRFGPYTLLSRPDPNSDIFIVRTEDGISKRARIFWKKHIRECKNRIFFVCVTRLVDDESTTVNLSLILRNDLFVYMVFEGEKNFITKDRCPREEDPEEGVDEDDNDDDDVTDSEADYQEADHDSDVRQDDTSLYDIVANKGNDDGREQDVDLEDPPDNANDDDEQNLEQTDPAKDEVTGDKPDDDDDWLPDGHEWRMIGGRKVGWRHIGVEQSITQGCVAGIQ